MLSGARLTTPAHFVTFCKQLNTQHVITCDGCVYMIKIEKYCLMYVNVCVIYEEDRCVSIELGFHMSPCTIWKFTLRRHYEPWESNRFSEQPQIEQKTFSKSLFSFEFFSNFQRWKFLELIRLQTYKRTDVKKWVKDAILL